MNTGKHLNRALLVSILLLSLVQIGNAQILTFEFSALVGSEETATSNSNDSNIGSSTISRGSGLTASGNGGRYNATSWALESIANAVSGNDYMEFTITPNSGYQFSVSSIYLQMQRSSTGPRAIALRNSVDSYASNLDQEYSIADLSTTQNFTFTFAQTNSSSPVTYRIYMWAEATSGSGGIGDGTGDDIIVSGTVSSIGALPDPEPTNHVSSFLATANGHNQIDLTWSDNDGTQAAAGFLVLINKTGTFSNPVDAIAQSNDTDLSDNAGVYNVSHGSEAYSWIGLDAETQYYFKIFPYSNSGSDIDYKTDDTVPTDDATTAIAPPNIVINEILADPNITTGDANGDGVVSTADDEFIEFVNREGTSVDISGWEIYDGYSLRHTIPSSTTLNDGEALVVFGGGTPTGIPGLSQVASTGALGLNNGGDDITLKNSSGTTVVTYTYGADAGYDQSIARDPDYTGSFVKHSTITGNPVDFSPGKTNTGDVSLPVELSAWKATSSQGLVKLLWTTDSEIENQGFIIKRRQEGQTASDQAWKEIASFATNDDLLGQGSTSSRNDYSYTDKQVKVGQTYSYRLSDVDYRGNVTSHDEISVTVKDAGQNLKPSDLTLHDAFPNPFNPSVNLSFTLENEAAALSLEIYDIQGALVQTLSSGYQAMGTHDFNWDGHDGLGNAVPSGVYLVRLGAGPVVQIQRVTLLR